MQSKAVIFDMDGLMLDTEWIYDRAWMQAASELGFEMDRELMHSCVGRTVEDGEALLAQALGEDFPLAEFRARWPVAWDEIVQESGIQCKPGLLSLLDRLESLNMPKAVATSSNRDEATFSLAAGGIAQRFQHVVTADQVLNGKPAPDLFLRAAEVLSVAPEGCVVFEDSEAGVVAATTAGMRAYMVPDRKQPSAEIVALAEGVFDSLQEALALFPAPSPD